MWVYCKMNPIQIEGFTAYAPDIAIEGQGFKSSYFSELARLESNHFWFRARNELLIWALKRYCPDLHSFLEIGCGTGYVLSGIANAFQNATLYGSELFIAGLHFAKARVPSVNLMQMDAREIPFTSQFAAIGAFDVLEHIEDDESVLRQVHKALKPGGLLFVTVPQHRRLWSPVDELACHVRRYEAADLHQKIAAAGFQVVRSTSFITTLLPVMMAARWFKKQTATKPCDALAELKIAPGLNALFFQCLRMELALIKKGLNFAVGGSRFVVAKRIG